MYKTLFFALHFVCCLNLSQAQQPPTGPSTASPSSSAPTTSSAPTSQPSATQPNAAPATSATGATLGPVKALPGKYEEYQSICRSNEFDNTFNLSDELKAKRIKLLKEKITSGKDVNRLQLRLLKEYIEQRKSNEATDTYAELKKLKLSDLESNMADGYIAFMQKKLKIAQTHFEKAVSLDGKNAEIAKFLADIYKEEKNYFEAAQVYQDLNKQFSGGYNDLLCEVLVIDSHHADGEKICRKAIVEKPENPYPLIFLGISSREKDILKDAYQYFNESIEIKPTEMAATCLAEVYFMQNKYAPSIEHFKKSLSLAPQSTRALIGLAWAQLKNKDTDEALQSFKKICQTDRKLISEIRKAYKFLNTQSSPDTKKFADQIHACIL